MNEQPKEPVNEYNLDSALISLGVPLAKVKFEIAQLEEVEDRLVNHLKSVLRPSLEGRKKILKNVEIPGTPGDTLAISLQKTSSIKPLPSIADDLSRILVDKGLPSTTIDEIMGECFVFTPTLKTGALEVLLDSGILSNEEVSSLLEEKSTERLNVKIVIKGNE